MQLLLQSPLWISSGVFYYVIVSEDEDGVGELEVKRMESVGEDKQYNQRTSIVLGFDYKIT